ncbi:sensor histidine kinase [Nevskia soli]|jgi:signal transduction histidine kinase|uniref:sensor histidine kinase n=1 Tax=Nevskia soli TaxID=418856 RepID=UPI0015D82D13|nr:sensor histidine kinase [Nevskia soli]
MQRKPIFVLLYGFGGLLLLIGASGATGMVLLHNLRTSDAALRQHFFERNHTLERIRSAIYLSGTYARDSLLAPEPSGAHAQIAALDSARRDAESAIEQYSRSLEPEEVAPFKSLRKQIESYWNVLSGTFSWTADQRAEYRYEFFYNELIPRRTAMLQIADQIAQLNDRVLQRGNDQLNLLSGRLQLGLVLSIVLALIGGIALAAFTSFEILRLQEQGRQQLEETVLARAGLRELSAKLIRAQEDERRSIARELHDEAGQSFSAILLESENLLDIGSGLAGERELRARLESIRELARRGVGATRDLALLLRPSMLDDFGLLPALNWQARETSRRTGMRVTVIAEDLQENLPEEHKTCIYRITQEALTNCARHAHASRVQIAVTHDSGRVLISIQDDGAGFDSKRTRGLGLLGIAERIGNLGGIFEVESQVGRGTLLKAELPLPSFERTPQAAAAL